MTTTYEISGDEFVERQTRALMDRDNCILL